MRRTWHYGFVVQNSLKFSKKYLSNAQLGILSTYIKTLKYQNIYFQFLFIVENHRKCLGIWAQVAIESPILLGVFCARCRILTIHLKINIFSLCSIHVPFTTK